MELIPNPRAKRFSATLEWGLEASINWGFLDRMFHKSKPFYSEYLTPFDIYIPRHGTYTALYYVPFRFRDGEIGPAYGESVFGVEIYKSGGRDSRQPWAALGGQPEFGIVTLDGSYQSFNLEVHILEGDGTVEEGCVYLHSTDFWVPRRW